MEALVLQCGVPGGGRGPGARRQNRQQVVSDFWPRKCFGGSSFWSKKVEKADLSELWQLLHILELLSSFYNRDVIILYCCNFTKATGALVTLNLSISCLDLMVCLLSVSHICIAQCTLCNCANAHIAWHGNGARHKSPKSCQRPGIPAASTADNLDPQVSTAILSSCVSPKPTIEVHWLGSLPLNVLSFSHSNCKT